MEKDLRGEVAVKGVPSRGAVGRWRGKGKTRASYVRAKALLRFLWGRAGRTFARRGGRLKGESHVSAPRRKSAGN